MNTLQVSVLVIAPPGRWRDSVGVLLRASGLTSGIELVDDGSSLPCLAGGPPAVVFLDAGLPEPHTWRLLAAVQRDWPQTQCVVLAHTFAEEQQARSAGADAVLQIGFSGDVLYSTIRQLTERSQR